jgi:virginiamycin B lyase
VSLVKGGLRMTDHDDDARQQRRARLRAGLLAGAAAVRGYLYWSNTTGRSPKFRGMIGRARLNGTGVKQNFIAVPNGPYGVSGLAVNSRYIYWTNETAGTIGRARLNGTRVNQRFITGARDDESGLAVDSRYIYWANADSIGRARLNGTDVNQKFVANRDFNDLRGVAVDPRR